MTEMKILRRAGEYEILTPKEHLEQQLLTIERAGRVCYQSEKGPITRKTASKFIRMLLRRGHESVIEHSSMTVRFSNVSRGFTHELVRHRLCAFSQESTRYVDESDLHFVVPPHRNVGVGIEVSAGPGDPEGWTPYAMVDHLEACYRALLQSGWKPEDARQFLPIGTRAQIVCTANLREWRHIFKMRTAKPAHWEIRDVMGRLLYETREILSPIFDDFYEVGYDKNGIRFWGQDPKHGWGLKK
jgi:thymidylate synthase (FAD)